MHYICCLEPPFLGENLISLGYNIIHKNPKIIPSFYSPKLSNFISKFFEKNPNNRPSAEILL